MTPPFGGLANGRGDGRGLEPVKRRLQALIVAQAGAAADELQDLVGRRNHQARGAKPCVASLDDLAGSPDQYVGVPYGRHAVIGDGLDADRHVAGDEIYRRDAMGLGEGKERISHKILRISGCEVTRQRSKQIELPTL